MWLKWTGGWSCWSSHKIESSKIMHIECFWNPDMNIMWWSLFCVCSGWCSLPHWTTSWSPHLFHNLKKSGQCISSADLVRASMSFEDSETKCVSELVVGWKSFALLILLSPPSMHTANFGFERDTDVHAAFCHSAFQSVMHEKVMWSNTMGKKCLNVKNWAGASFPSQREALLCTFLASRGHCKFCLANWLGLCRNESDFTSTPWNNHPKHNSLAGHFRQSHDWSN